MWGNTPYHYTITEHAKWVIQGCAEELISIFDLKDFDRKDGTSPYRGRKDGVKTTTAKVSANGSKPSGGLSRCGGLLGMLSFKLSALTAAITTTHATAMQQQPTIFQTSNWVDDNVDQADHLLTRVRNESGQVTYLQFGGVNGWAISTRTAKSYDFECLPTIQHASNKARELSDDNIAKEANERGRSHRACVAKAVSYKNGQIAHKMVKPKPDTIARAVQTKEGITTSNQTLADEQITIWAGHWNVGKIPCYVERTTNDNTDPAMINVTKKEIDDYNRIMRSFKPTTAVAYENLRPHQMAYLTDEAIAELITLFKRCALLRRWPLIWAMAAMVMLPKAEEGKWRLIAILTTPYRM